MQSFILNLRTIAMLIFAADKLVQAAKYMRDTRKDTSLPARSYGNNLSAKERKMLAELCMLLKNHGKWEIIPPAIQQWYLINRVEDPHNTEFDWLRK